MNKRIRLLIFTAAAALHIMLLLFARFGAGPGLLAASPPALVADTPGIMRLVNIQQAAAPVLAMQIPVVQVQPPAIQPPVPPQLDPAPQAAQPPAPAASPPPTPQAGAAEAAQNDSGGGLAGYLLQHQISALPVLPVNEIIRNVIYPPIARQLNIEGIVHLELFIDRQGNITNIQVLAETPANRGFGAAAADAFRGIRALRPAELNGVPVAVRFQYSFNFTLR